MKLLYFDCFAGAAGDMILGALIDAGLPLSDLQHALGSLGLDGWHLSADRVMKCGIAATKFHVHEASGHHGHHHPDVAGQHTHDHTHRSVAEIKHLIDHSTLSDGGKARAKKLFDRLAEAEAAIHNMPVEKIHLHEVGELDSIIDIVGAVFALEWFAADRIVCSAINVGSGTVRTAHGVLPVPAPATVRLLGKAPVYGRAIDAELLTPTGALILSDYADQFGPMPPMRIQSTGYGAGDRDLDGMPNVVRVIVGEDSTTESRRVVVIECEIDDMNPQIFGVLMDRLQKAGALDVFYGSVQMKKNRPGTLVTVVAHPDHREVLTDLLFRETTTIGVRYVEMERACLDRESVDVDTPLGPVRFKVARRDGLILNAQPEFDDIARIASGCDLPIKEVQAIAFKSWLDRR